MSRSLREANHADIPDLVIAYEWLFAAPGFTPPRWERKEAARTLASLLSEPDFTILIHEEESGIDGFCSVCLDIHSVRVGRRAWIEDLAVAPHLRSAGIGGQLFDAALAWARRHGASHLELDSAINRVDAHRFYERRKPDWTTKCYGWRLEPTDNPSAE